MTYFTSVTTGEPKPMPRLHLFRVIEPKQKEIKIRLWGSSKEEAYEKLKTTYPTASIVWIKEL